MYFEILHRIFFIFDFMIIFENSQVKGSINDTSKSKKSPMLDLKEHLSSRAGPPVPIAAPGLQVGTWLVKHPGKTFSKLLIPNP